MRKIILLSILVLSLIVTQAQKPYSQENLKNLSQEELDVYYNKALKLQKSGKTTTIIGGSVLGGTILTTLMFGDNWGMGGLLFIFPGVFGGLGAMAVGIPMNLTGKNRVERINSIRSTAYNDIRINLQPYAQYNYMTQNYQPALTLRISF